MKEPGKVSRMFAAGMEKVRVFTKKTERKAQDWSSQSVLKVEVTQLNYRRDKLISKLGEEVYDSFVTLDHATVKRDTAAISGILDAINQIAREIESKQKECDAIGEATATKSDKA